MKNATPGQPVVSEGDARAAGPDTRMTAALPTGLAAALTERMLADRAARLAGASKAPVPAATEPCAFLSYATGMGGPYLVRCQLPLGHTQPHEVDSGGCLSPREPRLVSLDTPSMPGEAGDSLWAAGIYPAIVELEGIGEPCPSCVEGTQEGRIGRNGLFVGCSRYPDCDYTN